jgi:hypothetical protein
MKSVKMSEIELKENASFMHMQVSKNCLNYANRAESVGVVFYCSVICFAFWTGK